MTSLEVIALFSYYQLYQSFRNFGKVSFYFTRKKPCFLLDIARMLVIL